MIYFPWIKASDKYGGTMTFLKTGFLQRLSNSKKEQEKETGDSWESAFCMRYDIHSHILPGVDDGAKDLHMAVDMVR